MRKKIAENDTKRARGHGGIQIEGTLYILLI